MQLTTPRRTDAVAAARRRLAGRADAATRALTSFPFRSTVLRLAVHAAGALCIAFGVALTIWTGLGPGPLDVFNVAVHRATHVPLPLVVWSMAIALMLLATLLGRRPGLGTLTGPLLTGPLVGLFVMLLGRFEAPQHLAAALALHVAGVGIVGFGAGALIVSGLGAGTGELLAGAAARLKRSDALVSTLIETMIGAAGVLLGGWAGVGTLVVMLTIGPGMRVGHRRVVAAVTWAQVRRALRRELRALAAPPVVAG